MKPTTMNAMTKTNELSENELRNISGGDWTDLHYNIPAMARCGIGCEPGLVQQAVTLILTAGLVH